MIMWTFFFSFILMSFAIVDLRIGALGRALGAFQAYQEDWLRGL
jgi:uncharacterized membrane protein required for colicin V production